MSKMKLRECPVCGHEAWPIAYGMVGPDAAKEDPKTVFAGCVMVMDDDGYAAEWRCQSELCGHEWY